MKPSNSNEWRKLLDDSPPIMLPDWIEEKVSVSLSARDSIYEQLLALKGQRVVDLVPSDKEDWDQFYERRGVTIQDSKIGVLEDVAKNVDNYISPTSQIFGKVLIDEKFQDFQWKAYTLHIGLDCNHNKYDYTRGEDGWSPKDWNEGFVITECKVNGVYFKKTKSPNDYDFIITLRNYYHLRSLGMFMYLPGRAYL